MYEATVGQYEDLTSLGEFESESAAYEALGRYAAQQDKLEYPRVTNLGVGQRYAVVYRDDNGYMAVDEYATEWDARAAVTERANAGTTATFQRVTV